MNIRRILESIRSMPKAAYYMLYFVLLLCCVMLFLSFSLFISWENSSLHNRGIYHLAVIFLETPAALLLIGGICVCFFIDRGQ